MSSKIRSKLLYRSPTLLEGVSRVFDVPGVLNDDFRVYSIHHVHRHHRKGGSDSQSEVMTASPATVSTRAINASCRRIRANGVAVACKMRPSIPVHT